MSFAANDDLGRLEVKPYQLVTAGLFAGYRRAIARRTVVAGHNARVDHGMVTTVHFDPKPQTWNYSFRARLSGARLRMGPGLLDGMEPQIGRVSIFGDAKGGIPTLKLTLAEFDEEGRSFICLRMVRADKSDDAPEPGKLNAKLLAVVQLAVVPGLSSGGVADIDGVGYWPLALLKRPRAQTRSFGKVHQNVLHDLTHRYSPESKRHFCFPAG